MKDGFIRGAAASIDVLVADPKHNCEKILETIQAADARNVKILVCPELVLTAYTCGDIFLHRCLLDDKASLSTNFVHSISFDPIYQ